MGRLCCQNFNRNLKGSRENEEKETRKCFKCGRIGHLRPDCPSRKEHREQGLAVTLSDTDSDINSDDQKIQAHMALTDGESSDAENQEKTWNEWYLDSGCSHHMTGDAILFSEIKYKLGG
ncbi:hypothetical protein LINGRAHAP2_LOCUS30487, partial [Linum grandiflorum]